MRLGIFGSAADAQCQGLQALLQKRGAEVVIVESQGPNQGVDCAFDGEDFWAGGQRLGDVGCWYLRHIMSPLPPAFRVGDRYHLFADWYEQYMHRRERFGFQLSWLAWLGLRRVPVVNPPEHGMVVQLKPFQLAAAREVGLRVPRTLITNNPQRVAAFRREVGQVVYKPSMGGGLCVALDDAAMGRLDLITAAPVTFQERVVGASVRATFVGPELASCVAIPTEALDYREAEAYRAGEQQYEACELPAEVVERCRLLMRHCGLLFSGIDFIRREEDGGLVFLEANSSPIYLDIERKTQVPITDMLGQYMLKLANDPAQYQKAVAEAQQRQAFVDYALPYEPDRPTRR